MPNFITKWRRNRWRDRVISLGRKQRALYELRAESHPDYVVVMSEQIEQIERKMESLRTKLRNTPPPEEATNRVHQ